MLNDLRRLPILDEVARRLARCLDRGTDSALCEAIGGELAAALADARRSMDDPTFGEWHFRSVLDRLGVLAEAAYLLDAGEEACASHLLAGLSPSRPSSDPRTGLRQRVEAVLGSTT